MFFRGHILSTWSFSCEMQSYHSLNLPCWLQTCQKKKNKERNKNYSSARAGQIAAYFTSPMDDGSMEPSLGAVLVSSAPVPWPWGVKTCVVEGAHHDADPTPASYGATVVHVCFPREGLGLIEGWGTVLSMDLLVVELNHARLSGCVPEMTRHHGQPREIDTLYGRFRCKGSTVYCLIKNKYSY